ncbi:TetR/AcrR family transcriptional regulator [Paenibacillus sp. M1]|uniref:TetR/AcrR family transcriptional regulator n=1 Tax=Paenibacillus haidiansis TaxID=1574488 RepID=A0ABU7VV64_9BACL
MPKQRIMREMILEAAFELARTQGPEHVMVKNIAEKLGCSVQPIYSYYSNMDELKQELADYTGKFFKQYIAEHLDKNDYSRSVGAAYIRLAQTEPHLYRLYMMRKRPDIHSLDDIYRKEGDPKVVQHLSEILNIGFDKAKSLYLNMIIYTQGLSFILATQGPDFGTEEILAQLDEAFKAFVTQAVK